jgi:hypothetical protein
MPSRVLAAVLAACLIVIATAAPRRAPAQEWNDARTMALVQRATDRRARQLADTGLTDYTATAHGYVTFLAQLGEGFTEEPQVVKSDELASEVYWRAPDLSKQRIVGRRDTLLLPTDINYHRDHLGIVQNNFPNFIRLGEGDEVRDVPHPLSATGMRVYDFAVRDSLTMRLGAQEVNVYRIDVRPKDAKQARLVGAVYVERGTAQVVRMAFSFTRASFLDPQLDEISVILESGMFEGRFWLPWQQEIKIQRTGSWLDLPARGIIRGRWEICCYHINAGVDPSMFRGPEIVQAPPAVTNAYPWTGRIQDALSTDIRSRADSSVRHVQEEARVLVREEALEQSQAVTLSLPRISDVARYNRVEGLAVGSGLRWGLGRGIQSSLRAQWGFDDHQAKGELRVGVKRANGLAVTAFARRQYRDAGDISEVSLLRNSFAAQEFGSDYTEPYDVRAAGLALDFSPQAGGLLRLEATREGQRALEVHAHPAHGAFEPTIPAWPMRATRLSLSFEGPPRAMPLGFRLTPRAEIRGEIAERTDAAAVRPRVGRAFASVILDRPLREGERRIVFQTLVGVVHATDSVPSQELVRFGGPVSAPGYDYHALAGRAVFAQHAEFRLRAPFPTIRLGRLGTVPASMTLAPYVHATYVSRPAAPSVMRAGWHPSVGLGTYLLFNMVRIDVARGLRDGRWTFSLDAAREFWRVL